MDKRNKVLPFKCEGLSQLECCGSFFVSLIFIPGKVKSWSDLSESKEGAVNSQTLSFHPLNPTTASGYNACPNPFVLQHKSPALQACSFPCKKNSQPKAAHAFGKVLFSRGSKWPLLWIHLPRNTLCMLFHDAADLSAGARGSLWEAHRQ